MYKRFTILFFSAILAISARAQETGVVGMASPKLKQFLVDHPTASQALSNVLSEAFSSRSVQLYYFYSEDESRSRAFHYYPDGRTVGLILRENQEPSDEFICLIFEALNSENESGFAKLIPMARSGSISKTDYVKGILELEFESVKKTKSLLKNVKFTETEMAESYSYNRYANCPDTFDDFLAYKIKVSPKRDQIKEYGAQYDYLRGAGKPIDASGH